MGSLVESGQLASFSVLAIEEQWATNRKIGKGLFSKILSTILSELVDHLT